MPRFTNDANAARLKQILDSVGHLLREAFLNLKPPGEHIHNPGYLAEPDHLRIGQVRDMHFAEKGKQMMLAHAEELDIAHNDEFVVLHVKKRAVHDPAD